MVEGDELIEGMGEIRESLRQVRENWEEVALDWCGGTIENVVNLLSV